MLLPRAHTRWDHLVDEIKVKSVFMVEVHLSNPEPQIQNSLKISFG
jgi:hypothetical protein